MEYLKMQKDLAREKRFYETRNKVDPIAIFYKKVVHSIKLVNFVEKKSKNNNIKSNARKNYVINLVTAAEVYFKDLVKILPEFEKVRSGSSKMNELFNEKITIWDAFQLFKNKEPKKSIKIGDIISINYTFQNLGNIDYVFSKILAPKFLDTVEQHKRILNKGEQDFFGVPALLLKSNLPKWREDVAGLFEARHNFIHHICFTDKLSYKQIRRFWWNLVCFIYAVDYFIRDEYLNIK